MPPGTGAAAPRCGCGPARADCGGPIVISGAAMHESGTGGAGAEGPRWRPLVSEAFKFGLVGGVGIAVNFAVFDLSRLLTPLSVFWCGFVGTGVAIVGNYLGFRYFTYRDRDKRRRVREFALFVLFSLAGLVIENGTLYAATVRLGWESPLQSNLAKAVGIVAATCFRFLTYRTWVFRPSRRPAAPGAAGHRPAQVTTVSGTGPAAGDVLSGGHQERRMPMSEAPIDQALILAGGRATRMRPYTDDVPKAMVPVGGVPIVAYQLAWLARHGVTRVTISGGYKHEAIRRYAGDGSRFGMEIRYAVESEPLGRGGGLKFAAGHLPAADAAFFVLNGDVITVFALPELSRFHHRSGAAVTVALSPYRSDWGVAELDEDGHRIRGFVQSPELPYWINAGVYVFGPEAVGMLPDRGDHEDHTFPQLARDGKLFGYRLGGYWRGLDTVKDVLQAAEEVPEAVGGLPPAFRTVPDAPG
ncbi:sugar phosphate nucleotidyltransferase [Streptomyces sp. AA1529]|uniref:sugar phosphate nucleotidyltransferase n=2 Tax=Streptomyces sp. AA1529 TaxID=1203257 RepID=UPI0009961241